MEWNDWNSLMMHPVIRYADPMPFGKLVCLAAIAIALVAVAVTIWRRLRW